MGTGGYIFVILERSDHSLKVVAHFPLSHCAATGKGHICIPFYGGEQIQKTVMARNRPLRRYGAMSNKLLRHMF
jgi:hypothetical protein